MGVKAVYLNGTAAEFGLLTVNERKQLAETWVNEANSKLDSVIVHVGHSCTEDAKELARHAEQIGANAIALVMPAYFKPLNLTAAVQYCKEVAAAAPETPFVYYHFPARNGVNINVKQFLKMAREQIPTLVGVKYTGLNLGDAAQCARLFDGSLEVMNGFDVVFLGALSMGITSSVGIGWSLMGPAGVRLIEAFRSGNLVAAQKEQGNIQDAIDALTGDPNCDLQYFMAHVKAALTHYGLPVGPTRSPVERITTGQLEAMKSRLNDFKFSEKMM